MNRRAWLGWCGKMLAVLGLGAAARRPRIEVSWFRISREPGWAHAVVDCRYRRDGGTWQHLCRIIRDDDEDRSLRGLIDEIFAEIGAAS